MNQSLVKTKIEELHVNYLTRNTWLKNHTYSSNNFKPDLMGLENQTFELKTRNFPHTQSNSKIQKGRSQFEWWSLELEQILKYEEYRKKSNTNLYWIFILGETEKELTSSLNLHEDLILKRTIYVCPWNIYLATNLSKGNFYNININKILKNRTYFYKIEGKNSIYLECSLPTLTLNIFN